MSLYHGTSANKAISIITEGAKPSQRNKFYCFDSKFPESMVGALCFVTADKFRKGCIQQKDLFSQYCKANPNFPKGIKGITAKLMLKLAASLWSNIQQQESKNKLDFFPAIVEFEDLNDAVQVNRAKIVNEVTIDSEHVGKLIIKKLWIEDFILNYKEIMQLKDANIEVLPISQFENIMESQLSKIIQTKKIKM